MSFRRIEEIHIGSNPPGMAFGGYVYDIKINFGFNGSATQVTVNVVNENGIYNINRNRDLSTINPIPIWISDYGDPQGQERFIQLPMMHLIEYTVQKTADSKILTLEFVDHSLLLDKTWVGLARKSALTHNLLMQPTSINEYSFKQRVISLPIKCQPCSKYKSKGEHGNIMSVGIREDGQEPELKTYKIPYVAGGGFVSNIHPLMGGALLIGTEEFASDPCRRKDVSYNWNDLVYALNKNNIIIDGIHDRGKSHYRARHGDRSLKDTLNAWCQDLGFDWTWDPMFNGLRIVGRDLTLATAVDLTPVQSVVENWSALSSDKSIITNLNESSSLKNTTVQDHISAYMKPMREKDYGDIRYKRVFNKNVKLSQVVPKSQWGMDRTEEEIMISVALAKFSKEARQLYNVLVMHDKFEAVDGWQTNPSLEPLGIESAYKFTEAEAKNLAILFFNPGNVQPVPGGQKEGKITGQGSYKQWRDTTFKRVWDQFDIYLGVFNSSMEDDWVEWEKQIADFLGKHYVARKEHENFTHCFDRQDYRLDVTAPADAGEIVNAKNMNDFKEISHLARGAPCVSFDQCAKFENSFNMTRGCWEASVPKEAWEYTPHHDAAPEWMVAPKNPNNPCCGYIFGIPQGLVLERGKTYRFLQTDSSWKKGFPDGFECMPCNSLTSGAQRGGKLRMVTEGGGTAEGWGYEGTPGINGIGTYTVPSEGEEAERVYLIQDPAANIAMGCAPGIGAVNDELMQGFVFNEGKNGNGDKFVDRYLVLKENPDGDQGEEWFHSKRSPMWGATQAQVEDILQDDKKTSLVTSILIEKYKIEGQLKNHMLSRFESMDTNDDGVLNQQESGDTRVNTPSSFGNVLRLLSNQGKDAYIIYIPKKKTINNKFTIGEWETSAKNSRENTYKMDEDDAEETDCKTVCDYTFVDRVCRCWPGEDFDVAPEVNGLLSDRANAFTMAVREIGFELDPQTGNYVLDDEGKKIHIDQWNSVKVLFPSFHDVAGYHKYAISYREVVREITACAGLITNGGNAMSFSVNRKDITSDIDTANPDPADPGGVGNPVNEENIGGAGEGLPGWQGQGEVVANLVVPTVPGLHPTNMGIVSIDTYHQEYLKGGNVIKNTWPSQALDFTVVGGHVGPLLPFMSSQYGLESVSISYGSQGLQTSFRFATRYPTPVPDQMIHQKVESQLNLNVFGRTS